MKRNVFVLLFMLGCSFCNAQSKLDKYIRSLGYHDTTYKNEQTITQTDKFEKVNDDGVAQPCYYEEWQEVKSYDEIISLDPNNNTVWPGAIIQGKSLQRGTLSLINLPRNPGTITISGLEFSDNKANHISVKNPSESTVKQNISRLLKRPVRSTLAAFSYSSEYYYTKEQALTKIGLNANWPTGDLKTQMGSGDFDSTNTFYVKLVQKYFSVSFSDPSSPGSVFSKSVSVEKLKPYMANDNVPALVTNVTYGRIIILTFTTTVSKSEFQAALNATFGGLVGGGSIDAQTENSKIIGQSKISIYAVGGRAGKVAKVITDTSGIQKLTQLKKYIEDGSEFSLDNPGAPIAYKVIYLMNNSTAVLNSTYSFKKPICLNVPYYKPCIFTINKFLLYDVCDDDEDMDFGYTIIFWGQNGKEIDRMSNHQQDVYVEEPSKDGIGERVGKNVFFQGERKIINVPIFKITIEIWAKSRDSDNEGRPWRSQSTPAKFTREFTVEEFSNHGIFKPWDRTNFDFSVTR